MDNNPQLTVKKSRENIVVYKSVDYSGFIERLFARGVDFLLVIGFGYLAYKWTDLTAAIIIAIIFDLVIRILMTYFLGGTVGKLVFGVRVISRCSGKLSIWQVIIRELSKYISGLFFDFGYISIIVSRRKRAWHDITACTAVTSGGREEAEYGREVYKERPEKWYVKIWAPIMGIFIAALVVSINKSSSYLLNDMGMIGFTKVISTMPYEFKYKLPSPTLGLAGVNKNIIQLGDIDGDKGYEVFKEGIKDGRPSVMNLRLTSTKPVDGDIGLSFDKQIIQYRMLDMNGDKKDELAVLFEDKMLKVYKLDGGAAELGSLGPIEYSDVISVIRYKPLADSVCKLYIFGDKNKVSVISMKDGKLVAEKKELADSYNFISFDTGEFSGQNLLAGATDDGRLVLYSNDGGIYKKYKEMLIAVKGKLTIRIKDLNNDGSNEVLIYSPENEERRYPVLAAYDISGDSMKIMWDGGRGYRFEKGKDKINLTLEDGWDIDNDKKFEAYLISKKVSDQDGRMSLFIFESNKYLFKINDFLRTLSFTSPK